MYELDLELLTGTQWSVLLFVFLKKKETINSRGKIKVMR